MNAESTARRDSPFYGMKLLEGRTLREEIRDYHDLPPGPKKREQLHRLLNCFTDVCHVVSFAHSRGIIHRDLKPANVVVGTYGETVVVDWGLARRLDDDTPEVPGSEATVPAGISRAQPSENSDSTAQSLLQPALTQQGDVLGTPAFMSPEQARGALQEVDAASDTYSLGATLYVLLTGRPPFHADTLLELLRQVFRGNLPDPRKLDRQIPAPLASICRKAMSRDPALRYPTAAELAADMTRYLAGESVTAHRDNWPERAARFCRRHPALTTGLLLGAVVVTVASIIVSTVVRQAHQAEQYARAEVSAAHAQEKKAREVAEAARQRTVHHLQECRTAFDTWLIDLSGTLQHFPVLEPVRNDLIRKGITHYHGLSESIAGDPHLTLQVAQCQLRASVDLLKTTQPEQSNDEARLCVALTTLDLADVLADTGSPADAAAHRNAAIQQLRQLSDKESPAQRSHRDSATVCLIQALLERVPAKDGTVRTVRLLLDLNASPSVPARVHQLTAVAQLAQHRLPEARTAIEYAQAARRFPVAVDSAIRGCIAAEQENLTEAQQLLAQAKSFLSERPGDRRLQNWTGKLAQLVRSHASEAADGR
ncbi:MAG: serine/threonine-protein kinase [Fuerstiella sp.]